LKLKVLQEGNNSASMRLANCEQKLKEQHGYMLHLKKKQSENNAF
jgi:hypothetical protein